MLRPARATIKKFIDGLAPQRGLFTLWRKDGAKEYYIDKFTNTAYEKSALLKAMDKFLPGMPINYEPARIEDSADFVRERYMS